MFTAFDRVWPLVGLAFALATIVCWITLFRPSGNYSYSDASFSHSRRFADAQQIASAPSRNHETILPRNWEKSKWEGVKQKHTWATCYVGFSDIGPTRTDAQVSRKV